MRIARGWSTRSRPAICTAPSHPRHGLRRQIRPRDGTSERLAPRKTRHARSLSATAREHLPHHRPKARRPPRSRRQAESCFRPRRHRERQPRTGGYLGDTAAVAKTSGGLAPDSRIQVVGLRRPCRTGDRVRGKNARPPPSGRVMPSSPIQSSADWAGSEQSSRGGGGSHEQIVRSRGVRAHLQD
jgi:hypothetical protein